MKNFRVGLILMAATFPGIAQTWDNTGNKKLNGNYYFREVTTTSSDAYSIYGTITFTDGTYSSTVKGCNLAPGPAREVIRPMAHTAFPPAATDSSKTHSSEVISMVRSVPTACLSAASLRPVSTISS